MPPKLIVFARAPKPGAVKTRLGAAVSADAAAALHVAMVTDLITRLHGLRPGVDIELHTSAATDAFSFPEVGMRVQAAGNLGDRLGAAIVEALEGEGRPAVIVMGSDSPTVPLAHLRQLLASEADVAIGPASDGGYYAIACRKAHSSMFDGVTWSAPTTAAETVAAVRKAGLTVAFGSEWYDIDTPADLERLANDPEVGAATLRALGAGE